MLLLETAAVLSATLLLLGPPLPQLLLCPFSTYITCHWQVPIQEMPILLCNISMNTAAVAAATVLTVMLATAGTQCVSPVTGRSPDE